MYLNKWMITVEPIGYYGRGKVPKGTIVEVTNFISEGYQIKMVFNNMPYIRLVSQHRLRHLTADEANLAGILLD